MFGIGLHLYNGSSKTNDKGMNRPSGNKGNGNVTKAQLSKIKSLRTGLGMSSDDVLNLVERMYNTRDPKDLNREMASAIISVLEKQKEETGNEEEVV